MRVEGGGWRVEGGEFRTQGPMFKFQGIWIEGLLEHPPRLESQLQAPLEDRALLA